ncbi:putative thiol oxidoreductase [Labilithrix luteola]|uniref:Putative thiol oxidoreductase n=1 Tax=Labilithrix luteola TaxID=1391654 RepID=A0A0K1PZ15_9BACT|nr:di-heme oxidoredictase family protein [Labilithrix luteola]AKU98399.1 putative thiol oxidoreductase [Labilithrix luteola]
MRLKNGSVFSITAAILVGACSAYVPDGEESTDTNASAVRGDDDDQGERGRDQRVHAQVIATGIPGAGAVCQVAPFRRSSPIHDRADFAAFTVPGAVLNKDRLLVASTSNFGAPLGRPDQYAGTVLSIDPSGSSVAVPGGFAVAGDQASAVGGRVQVYASNNSSFLNSRYEPQAVTPNEVTVSLPTGISINNGNGRPWISNAPTGANGDGTITVVDPNGAPLAGAPFPTAGGVFSGNVTNRNAQSTHGLTSGAIGTAIITKSSDGGGKAVFAAVEADGSIVQVHVAKGVDGLVPAGTISPLSQLTPSRANSNDKRVVARAGLAFNWAPNRVLYVADPQKNRVVAFDITDDGTLFKASAPRSLDRRGRDCDDDTFDIPIDVAPTVPEVASENFSSNTTLAVGADLYVLNRGNNSIVRITQDGRFVAKRSIVVDGYPGFRANGLGVSPDGKTIWVTGQTSNTDGIVVKLDGFGSGPIMADLMKKAAAAGATSTEALGDFFFTKNFSIAEGVGPLFNATSCDGCHGEPFVGGMSSSIFDTFFSGAKGGPVTRSHSITELGGHCGLKTGLPAKATSSSRRSTMTLRSTSLIDFVLPTEILKNQALQPAAVRGRPNILPDGRIGRFGWKANVATLIEFMGDAFRNEQGLTNGLVREDQIDGCGANKQNPELDAVPLVTTAAFLSTIDAPAPTAACLTSPGATVFKNTGCSSCHTASFPGPGFTAYLYSDLLLHDMGPALADGFVQGSATGSEFRTMTLVKLSERSQFLHDGRAATPADAIRAHGGQGAASAAAFGALSSADRDALLSFLGCL